MSLKKPPAPKAKPWRVTDPASSGASSAGDEANRETWKQLRLEADKTLLQLSLGAIGLLVGFVAPAGLVGVEVLFFVVSLLCLLLCVAVLLRLMPVNADIMEAVITRDEEQSETHETKAERLSRLAKILFGTAVVTAAVVSTLVGIRVGKEKEAKMSDDKIKPVAQSEEEVRKSLEGAYRVLVPTPPPAPVGQPSQPTTPASGGGDAKKE